MCEVALLPHSEDHALKSPAIMCGFLLSASLKRGPNIVLKLSETKAGRKVAREYIYTSVLYPHEEVMQGMHDVLWDSPLGQPDRCLA